MILAPTRELAVQIEDEAKKLGKYCPISTGAFYGGVSYGPQIDMLRDNVQIIIGTPGRIIDLVQQGKMLLKEVGFLVIDEADRMFDMGFIDDLRKLIRYLPPPKERQTFLFSATLNVRVKNLAWEYMDEPAEIVIEAEQVTVDTVTQELYHVGSDEKFRVLLGLLAREKPSSCLIFCNQKYMAEEVARRLGMNGINCDYIMGDLPQKQRLAVIDKLKAGKVEILVATDVAARGLDVDGLDLVVNYDLPLDAESYVHRIGRTARAGKSGKAITLACEKFVYGLAAVEKYIEAKIPSVAFDDSLLVEDKSANARFGRPRRDDDRRGGSSRDRGPLREHGQRDRDRGRGGLDRQGPNRGSRDGRSSNRPNEKYGRPRSSSIAPIQRSIAEAAGQSTDGFPEEARQLKKRPQGAKGQGGRQDGSQRRDGRPQGGRPQDDRTRSASGNPYEMSTDERMKHYKEKYAESGKRQGGEAPRRDERGQAREGQNRQGQGRQGGKPRDAQAQGGKRPNQGQRPAQGQRQSQAPASQKTMAPQAPAKKPGLIDRLKGLFGGKKKK